MNPKAWSWKAWAVAIVIGVGTFAGYEASPSVWENVGFLLGMVAVTVGMAGAFDYVGRVLA